MSIKQVIKKALFHLGILAVIRRVCPRKELAVLRYHAVCDKDCTYATPTITVTPEGFRNQIRYLSKNYTILDLDKAVSMVRSGKPLPPNALAITFDDGYADNFAAYKILRIYGATATFFITTNCIDDKEVFWVSEVYHLVWETHCESLTLSIQDTDVVFPLFNKDQKKAAISKITRMIKSCTIPERESIREAIRSQLHDVSPLFNGRPLMLNGEQITEMIREGMKVGGHTLTHCNLPSAGCDAAREEITQCRADLERIFNTRVTTFAYPNGGANAYFNEDIKRLVREASYESAWTSKHGYVDEKTDWWQSPRLAVTESLVDLIYLMEGDRLRDALNKQ